jgi:hypothetical protein
MAHFAKISENNEVLQVLTMDNNVITQNGVEIESLGQVYLEKHHHWPAHLWKQTSYNTKLNTHSSGDNSKAFRGNYAGIGGTWDEKNQIFWREKPYSSWVKDLQTASWKSPLGDKPVLTEDQISQNTSGTNKWFYYWSEQSYQLDNTTGWKLIDLNTAESIDSLI